MAVACSAVLFVGVLTLGFGFNAAKSAHGTGTGRSFLTLAPGFTQEIFAVHPSVLGGVAFAPDGDPLVANCHSGSPLQRFDRQGVAPVVNGTNLHPVTTLTSNATCGLTNHPNGALYSNTVEGVVKLDADTGAFLAGPFGPSGNGLGIAPDPQTDNLVYVGSDGTIHFVDAAFTTTGVLPTVTTGDLVDGISFDPSGDFLFLAILSPSFALTIIRRDGTLVQDIPMSMSPDGIAFRSTAPKFVVTNNLDGTMTRFDFPGDDFTQVPVQSVFASGGHRGDLIQAGPDGCLFVTQAGTRYDNGTVTGENSLVRICSGSGGFDLPPGVPPLPPGVPPLPPGVPPLLAVCDGLAATLVGTAGNDRLVGTAARDIIAGLEGNDVIQGLGGNDLICGGPGNDLIRGGAGRDRLLGEAGRDDLRGEAGRDVLEGGPGNDKLNGGGGKDSCKGGAGRDGARGCERVNGVP